MSTIDPQSLSASLAQLGIPPSVAHLTIRYLRLSTRTLNALLRAGIRSIEQLAAASDEDLLKIKSFGTIALKEARQALLMTSYEELSGTAFDQEIRSLTIENSDSHSIPSEISVAAILDDFLARIPQRHAKVLQLRHSLDGNAARTLEEIGQSLGITRERVRQIERKAIDTLQRPNRRYILDPLILLLEQKLLEANGILSFQMLQEVLIEHTEECSFISDSLVAFILLFAPRIIWIKDPPILVLSCEPYTAYIPSVDSIYKTLKRIVDQARTSLSLADVLSHFVADPDVQSLQRDIPESFIVTCLNAHPDIIVDEANMYSSKHWPSKRLDTIVSVLRQHGRPLHYNDIADLVNQHLPADQQATVRSIHYLVSVLSDVFVRVGRGIFGLAEWGLKQDRCLADAAYRILSETGHALPIEQLIDRILETWQVRRGSVRVAINIDSRFVRIRPNMYWLAETPIAKTTSGNDGI